MSKEKKKLAHKNNQKIIKGFYTGSLLVSTPDILDPRFNKSVIYLILASYSISRYVLKILTPGIVATTL